MRRIYPFIFTLFCFFSASAQKQNVEIIWVLPSGSDSILVYYHVNTHFPSIERRIGPFPDHGVQYLAPNEVQIDSLNESMTIDGGEFSLIEIRSKKELVTTTEEGLSLFRNIAPIEIEDAFDLASFMWIFPESAHISSYSSNIEGSFVELGNHLLFTGKQVNKLEFEIYYSEAPCEDPGSQAENPGTLLEDPSAANQSPDTLFTAGIPFETGKWELGSGGLKTLEQVLEKTRENPHFKILVTGHTDPQPFKAGAHSNNWDLSAKRASEVVGRLIEMGIPEAQISASFHAQFQGENREARIYLLSDVTGL